MSLKISQNSLFIVALLVAASAGIHWRDPAHALAEYRNYLLFFVMFLVGLEQTLPALAEQFKKIGAITLSLASSYILFPVWAWFIGYVFFVLFGNAAEAIHVLAGFVVLGAAPTTLTSAVIYTRLDQGNDRLALIIVLLSQLLCVVLTPLIVSFFLSKSMSFNTAHMIGQLLLYFLLPLGLGILVARFVSVERFKAYFTIPEQLVVALFVFMGAAHIPAGTTLMEVGKTFLAVMLLQMTYVVVIRLAIRKWTPWDQTALFFTATQKTITVGLYLFVSYFPSADIMPLVLYHLAQLIIGRLYWRPPKHPCQN